MKRTLGSMLARRDERGFVGRRKELEFLESLTSDDPVASVVFVHGSGGVGKSALLREFARRAERSGWKVFLVQGGNLPPIPEALEEILSGAREAERPLVMFDGYDQMAGMGAYLREELLPTLPENTVVVIAARRVPEPAWFTEGWESIVVSMELRGLPEGDAQKLLSARGVKDKQAVGKMIDWAGGSPLALTLAADTARSDPDWSPDSSIERPETVRALVDRLSEGEFGGANFDLLSVAAIARVTTVDLLRNVLPERDPEGSYKWLQERTFTEPFGEGVRLHDLMRRAIYADLMRRDPERERELKRLIVDYIHALAVQDRLVLTIDIAHLVQEPTIRWGYSWEGSDTLRIDSVRAADVEKIQELLAKRDRAEWWASTRPFFEQAPDRVAIARDLEGEICGYLVSLTPHNAPPFSEQDPIVGPWLAHAKERYPDGNAVIWRDSVDFTGDPKLGVRAMVNMAGILRSGLSNPSYAYLPIDPMTPGATEFSRAIGAKHVPELDVELGGRQLECHMLDYGPGGILGAQRNLVYRELGLPLPRQNQERSTEVDVELAEAVREALRNLHNPNKLVDNKLATGWRPKERAASVRQLIEHAAEHAFGSSESEDVLRSVLMRGYIDPPSSHEKAAEELFLSRATYFRRLREASDRITEYLAHERSQAVSSS